MRLRILDEAENEMREAAQWYERQQRTMGHVFLDAILLGFDEIERHPQRFSHPPGTRSRSIRRYLSANFPYSIVYEVFDDEIVVLAVAHTARKPGYWSQRSRK